MARMRRFVVWLVPLVLWSAGALRAEVYYVDYAGGSDENDGAGAQSAFKHCPGDTAAGGRAKTVVLKPGDTVLFKGGVAYRSTVTVGSSGTEDKPIVYDGNTAGTFGEGRAVIDGSELLTGWRRCESADQCGGNPNWRNIYYAYAPKGSSPFEVNLTQGDGLLAVAQDPNPADPFFEDVIDTWQPVAKPLPGISCPVEIVAGKGLHQNSARPYVLMLDGKMNTSAVIDPCVGAELTFRLKKPVTAAALAIASSRHYQMPKDVVFLADGAEVLRATLEPNGELQRFELQRPPTFRELTLKVLTVHDGKAGFGAICAVRAFDGDGRDVLLSPPVMAYRDAAYFTQKDPHFWDQAYFVIYARPNVVYYQKVLRFDPPGHAVEFEMLGATQYKDTGRFTMMNALGILDRPGEFVVEVTPQADGTHKVFAWPLDEKAGPEGIGYSKRAAGVVIRGAAHVRIQGFRIEKQGGSGQAFGITGAGSSVRHITICDNEITMVRSARHKALSLSEVSRCTITRNFIHENRRAGGIHLNRSTDCEISHNRLHKNGATGLSLYGCQGVKVLHNTVTEHKGMHANGLTAYLGCKDILFFGNRVSGGNVGLTLQEGDGITVACNVIDGGGTTMCVGLWNVGNLSNVRIVNNTFVRSQHGSSWAAGIYAGKSREPMVGYVMKNNIIDGTCGEQAFVVERSHNIYTRRAYNEREDRGWKPAEGERIEEDLDKIFVDAGRGDFRLKPGSPALDAGADVGLREDIAGTSVPQGKAPDIGACEYAGQAGR